MRALLCAVLFAAPNALAAELPPWTVKNSVEVRYFVEADPTTAADLVVLSPQADRFFILSKRGDLSCDCNRYELQVFNTSQVARALEGRANAAVRPERLIEMRSRTNYAAIDKVRWIDAGASLAFLGADDLAAPQVYRLDLASGKLTALTDVPLGVVTFDLRADSLIYLAVADKRDRQDLDRYPFAVVGQYDLGIALGVLPDSRYYATYVSYKGGTPQLVGKVENNELAYWQTQYWISPDGERAVYITPLAPADVPREWRNYDFESSARGVARLPEEKADWMLPIYGLRRFMTVDLRTAQCEPMADSPTGEFLGVNNPKPHAIWSADGDHVAIVNIALPLRDSFPERASTAYVADFVPASRSLQPLESLTATKETAPGREAAEVSTRPGGITVAIEQAANEPPVLIAARGNRRLALTSPDPAVTNVRWVKVKPITWQDRTGRSWSGGLMLPSVKPPKPLPLVVQMYHFAPDKFLPDGSFSTGYAAQPLASSEFAVLQMRLEDVEGLTTPREGPSFVEGLDSAVEHLASLNLVDPNRVALIGFSRCGYLTSYAVANPGRVRLAAAVDADGGDPSYVQYLIDSVVSPSGRVGAAEYEQLYGGGSFWENRSAWLRNAPGFNTDRVQTPLLLTVNGVKNRTSFLELYVGLRANGRPVELLHFPQGEHELKKPREREASLQATLDWVSFWLMGVESAATPASSERFSRWRAMRSAWRACCAKTSESASTH